MSRDELATGALVGSLALWIVLHLIVSVRLAGSPPRWRAPLAFVVPPLAPYWAFRGGARTSAIAWVAALLAWGVCRVLVAR